LFAEMSLLDLVAQCPTVQHEGFETKSAQEVIC